MKYTMRYRNNEIKIDTDLGVITGNTYQMRDIIKSDLYATWDAKERVWVSDNLAETINNYKEYLTRCYNLSEYSNDPAATETTAKEISRELVNGSDGFYLLVRYSNGNCRKVFAG